MASHYGKRRSHPRFLRNLGLGGGGFDGFVACSASFSSFCDSFFFFTQNKEGLITYLNYSPLKNQNLSISFFNQQKAGKGK